MTTKHTPGPWRVEADGNIVDQDGCDVVASHADAEGGHYLAATEENRRLIAAAPDLLAALTTMMWCIDAGYAWIKNGEVYDAQTQLAVEAIRAAIAKAKGKA